MREFTRPGSGTPVKLGEELGCVTSAGPLGNPRRSFQLERVPRTPSSALASRRWPCGGRSCGRGRLRTRGTWRTYEPDAAAAEPIAFAVDG